MFKHFRRITSSGNYIAEIDGVRFIAIVMVLIQHLHERVMRSVSDQYPDVTESYLDHLLKSGGLGVSIFFALSGYVLYSILKNNKAGLKKYYLRRVTRLEPPYIIVTTIIFLALVLGFYHGSGKFLGKGGMPLWQSYLATITYLHGIVFGSPPSVNPPGWSLETEVQFYILAPLLAAGMVWCKDWRLRVGLLIAIIALWAVFIVPKVTPHPHINASLLHWLPYFLVGFVIFEVVSHKPQGGKPSWGMIDLLAVGALIGLPIISSMIATADFWRCLGIGIFLLGALSGTWLRRLLQTTWIANVGGMCYTIYLVHVPCIELLVKVTTQIKLPLPYIVYLLLQALLVLPPVLLIAAISFLLVERPCMNKNWPADLWLFLKKKMTPPFASQLSIPKQSPTDE